MGIWLIDAHICSDAIGLLAQQKNPSAGVIASSRRYLTSVDTSDDAIGFALRANHQFSHHGIAAGDRGGVDFQRMGTTYRGAPHSKCTRRNLDFRDPVQPHALAI